jgi:hypothetical protein
MTGARIVWSAEDQGRTFRELFQGNFRSICRATNEAVFIVTVRHAARLLAPDKLIQ